MIQCLYCNTSRAAQITYLLYCIKAENVTFAYHYNVLAFSQVMQRIVKWRLNLPQNTTKIGKFLLGAIQGDQYFILKWSDLSWAHFYCSICTPGTRGTKTGRVECAELPFVFWIYGCQKESLLFCRSTE